ncbi:hypothetical protein [Roseomonas sp. BN140053]|uniref:hypothetical protein n=1 Tax=Roseomonas sp. BN140053 TaxID=3391898 RepID=UPI0039E81EE5
MTDTPESPLAMAGRHVVEAEARVRRQAQIVAELERDGHPDAAIVAPTVLATLETTLDLMREHLRIEREAHSQ